MHPMYGHLTVDGQILARAGFMHPAVGPAGFKDLPPSIPVFTRGAPPAFPPELIQHMDKLERGEITGDIQQILLALGTSLRDFQRGITSGMTAFPVRENLEAEAKLLIPLDTPFRNRLTRTPGAGKSSAWKQKTSLGGGWGASYDQPGGGATAIRAFFAETGAPAEHTTVYADKSATYKLLGTYGSVTGLAMAAGANFMAQLATEKRNAILNLLLDEENALINGDSASTAAPWGDGTNALSFDGIVNLVTTGNGTPSAQVQTSVGALTTAHLDAQLNRLWKQGAQGLWMLMNAQEIQSLTKLAQNSASIIRVTYQGAEGVLGFKVSGYMHPVSGEVVTIIPSRFLPAGTLIFGSDRLPDGSPTMDVDVLPQVELPELAPNESVQGYTAQELAPTTVAPQVYPFIVSVYEVLRLKSAAHVAKSTGVTAAA